MIVHYPHDAGAEAAMIAAIVVSATVGDVLIASAMRTIGDLDHIRAERGLGGAILAVTGQSPISVRSRLPDHQLLLSALRAQPRQPEPHRPRLRLAHLRDQRRGGKILSSRKRGPPPLDRRRSGLRGRRVHDA